MVDLDTSTTDWLAFVAQLGDSARVRMLRLLELEELGVGELAKIVQLPQSTVSRHLKALHEHGWIQKRSEGTASLYRVQLDVLETDQQQLWKTTRDRLRGNAALKGDDARLGEVVANRRFDSRAYFGRIGGEWQEIRAELFGNGFGGEALLSLIDPSWVVADLGCGTGDVARRLAPVLDQVIAIDREAAMLKACSKRLAGFENVHIMEGDLEQLPLEAGALDAGVISLVMHHIVDPMVIINEAARVIRPGGLLLVLDMVAHDREDYRFTMGHAHLGFDEATVASWVDASDFSRIRYRHLPPNTEGRGPGLFVASLFR